MTEDRTIKQLPEDWRWVKLGEVCEIKSGKNQSKVINPKGKYPIYGSSGIFGYADEYICNEGTTIIGRKGTINSPLYIQTKFWNVDTAFGISPSVSFHKKLLYYFCLSFNFHKLDKSTTIPSLAKTDLLKIDIPLPSASLQTTLVCKIEELFSEVDKGIEEIKTAQQQLKVYRQAVLKGAFEGKLTTKDVKEGVLPKGWKMQKLDEIGVWRGGGTPSTTRSDFWENGNILWVSPKDMKSKVIHDTIDKITFDAVEKSTAQLIPTGSILFVVRSGILRRTLPVAITISDVTVNQDIKAFTPKEVHPDYIFYYVQAKNDDIRRTCSKDGTTVESIETSSLKSYKIPICSKEEQQQIVQEIESRLSVCDKIEETITSSLKQAEALRQSILKKAFEGKLI